MQIVYRNKLIFNIRQAFTIAMMCGCLGLLVTLNFFAYPQQLDKEYVLETGSEEDMPQAPEEEKSNGGNGINNNIQEEYIHEKHGELEIAYLQQLYHSQIAGADKLTVVHFDLISPPPKFL
jgi:hypothetical protein